MLARYRLNACLTDEPRAAGGVDGLEECATNEAPSREWNQEQVWLELHWHLFWHRHEPSIVYIAVAHGKSFILSVVV